MKVGASPPRPGCGARGRWRGLVAKSQLGASEAWLRCPWAVAGPGRASRSITPSRRVACGDLAGGPPPTGTQSSPAVATGRPRAPRRGPRPTPEPVRHLTADFSSYAAPPIGQRRHTFRPAFLTRDLTRDKTLPPQCVCTQTGTKLSLHGQNSPNSTFLGEQGEFCHGQRPKAPRPGTFCPTTSCTLVRSPTGSHVHRLLHRWADATHGASEAWLRCPWVVAGPGRASRSITPSRRVACGDLAGGPPPTGTQSSPAGATGRPRAHKAARPWPRAAHGHTKQPGRGRGSRYSREPGGCTST